MRSVNTVRRRHRSSSQTRTPRPPASASGLVERPDTISREDALRLLGVKRQTLYTYVSRGWIQSFPVGHGRAHRFSRSDVERLRSRSLARQGVGAVAQTVMRYGEPILVTRITEITDLGPRYRGRPAVDLATEGHSFETVAHWLWTGVWIDDHIAWRDAPDFVPTMVSGVSGTPDFATRVAGVVLELGEFAAEGEVRRRSETLAAARSIIQVQAGMLGLLTPVGRYCRVCPGEPLGSSIARILGGVPGTEAFEAINAMMVLCADYELTPASFAARVVASSGGAVHACVAAGLCAHSGLLNGSACDRLSEVMSGQGRGQRLEQRLEEMRAHGMTRYGFNPPLATTGDPRAYWMIERAAALIHRSSTPEARNILRFLTRIREDFGLYPGLSAGLVALGAALGLPPRSAAAIWGLARTAGQIAHVIEQRSAGFILRPRAVFEAE